MNKHMRNPMIAIFRSLLVVLAAGALAVSSAQAQGAKTHRIAIQVD